MVISIELSGRRDDIVVTDVYLRNGMLPEYQLGILRQAWSWGTRCGVTIKLSFSFSLALSFYYKT